MRRRSRITSRHDAYGCLRALQETDLTPYTAPPRYKYWFCRIRTEVIRVPPVLLIVLCAVAFTACAGPEVNATPSNPGADTTSTPGVIAAAYLSDLLNKGEARATTHVHSRVKIVVGSAITTIAGAGERAVPPLVATIEWSDFAGMEPLDAYEAYFSAVAEAEPQPTATFAIEKLSESESEESVDVEFRVVGEEGESVVTVALLPDGDRWGVLPRPGLHRRVMELSELIEMMSGSGPPPPERD